jgi:hypothetical protein
MSDHYEKINILPDMFNELPRIKSPGYSETHSIYDYWNKKELRSRWLPVLYKRYLLNDGVVTSFDMREAIAGYYGDGTTAKDRIIEPRQAKCTITKGAYLFCSGRPDLIMNQQNASRLHILDVPSAYGDRMLTAISCNVGYYLGIDPYPDLKQGYDEILRRYTSPSTKDKYHYSITPFETHLLYKYDFNMTIMSPPPHTMEKYGYDAASSVGQSWDSYPDRTQWLINFMLASIHKVYMHTAHDGSFYLTILDRLKGEDKLICTEALLMYATCIGFDFQHILYWEGGTVGMGTPFWIFKKKNIIDAQYYTAFKNAYPTLFDRLENQLNLRFNKIYHIETPLKTDPYDIVVMNPKYKHSTTLTEIIRFNIVNQICKLLHKAVPSITLKKIQTYFGRWIMIQSINKLTNIDPFFPSNGSHHDQLISNLASYSEEKEYKQVFNSYYILSDIRCKGISELCNVAIVLTETIENRLWDMKYTISKELNEANNTIQLSVDVDMSKIERESLGIPLTDISKICILDLNQYNMLVSKCTETDADTCIYNCILRYASLGDRGHQFTREEARFQEYKSTYNVDFELFGAPFNVHASYHMSLFYDTDKYFGSYGSFFNATLTSGVYTANPPNDDTFVVSVSNIILKMLKRPHTKLTFLMGLVVWNDDDHLVKEQQDIKTWYIANGKNTNVKQLLQSKYVKDFKLVDTQKYKTLDPISGKMFITGTERIPMLIVLSNL